MANAKHGDIIDYAMPMMQIEQLMKRIHALCLEKKYKEAGELGPYIIAQARMLTAALSLMDAGERKE